MFDSVYLVALTAWVGSILFFSFGVAPIIFRVLGAEAGGKFVRALFPRYYLWGAISGAVALPAFVAGPLCYQEYRGPMVGVQAMVILAGILIMLYGGNSLTPAINRRVTPVRPATSGSSSSIAARSGSTPWSWSSALGSWLPSRPARSREHRGSSS